MTATTSDDRIFILGLGAQKAGTTWLYDYLAASGAVATHEIKEYHVWDALRIPGLERSIVRPQDAEKSFENRVRHHLQQSPENYFTYFAYMMNQQGLKATCDITPLYSGLQRDVLDLIRQGFAARGIATRPVFLMRDPVERCWSAARMERRNGQGHTAISEEEVLQHARSTLAGLRSRYDNTVAEIEAVFAADEVHYGIYEEMFESENLARLSAFCRVPLRPGRTGRKVNVSEVTVPISDAACAAIAAHYRSVYDFAARRFPQTAALWRGFRYL